MRRAKPKVDPLASIPIDVKAIPLLMSRPKIPWKVGNRVIVIEPEQKLCIQFADKMRELTASGAYEGIWLHIPNERKAHVFTMMILRAMGVITGAWDYIFIGPWGCACLEFKEGSNTLSEYQRYFRFWLRKWDIPHEEVRTVAQAISALKKWGALKEELPKSLGVVNENITISSQPDGLQAHLLPL